MLPADQPQRGGRETRLLLVTILVSVGVLLLLARFRFPGEAAPQPADPAPAPLERLAARAAYDDLASTMVDLERRILPRVMVLGVQPEQPGGRFVIAPRMTANRAVAILDPGETLEGLGRAGAQILTRDLARDLAVLSVPAAEEAPVPAATGPLRTGPRYVAVVEGTRQGPIIRPVYVGRTSAVQEPRTGTPHLRLSALQYAIPEGAAVFSLEGAFIGLVREGGSTASLVPGEFLKGFAEGAEATPARGIGVLGLDVQPLTDVLARAAGTDRGVMVSNVGPHPGKLDVEPGDVIQAVDGTPVLTVPEYRQLEQTRVPGQEVVLTIVSNGKRREVTVTARDAAAAPDAAKPAHGIVGRSVPGAGIEVVAVQPGSSAARAGVQRGDLIVSVAGRRPADLSRLARAFGAAKAGDVLLVVVQRDENHQVLPLEKR